MLGDKEEREDLWRWVRMQQSGLRREGDQLKSRLRAIELDLERYAKIEKAAKPNPCKECKGHGKIRHWIAQDESQIKTCESCKGTGEGPEKDPVTQLGELT